MEVVGKGDLRRANFEVPELKNGNDSDVDNVIAFGFDWESPGEAPGMSPTRKLSINGVLRNVIARDKHGSSVMILLRKAQSCT